MLIGSKNGAKFRTVWPPVKTGENWLEMSTGIIRATHRALSTGIHFTRRRSAKFCRRLKLHLTKSRENNCLMNSLTICDPVASHIEPESSVTPFESIRHYLFHHRHVEVDGIVQEQGIDRTLHTDRVSLVFFLEAMCNSQYVLGYM